MPAEDNAIAEMRTHYAASEPNTLGLFLGAGVNLPAGSAPVRFRVLSWLELLEALHVHRREGR